jgi:hypothetical protein
VIDNGGISPIERANRTFDRWAAHRRNSTPMAWTAIYDGEQVLLVCGTMVGESAMACVAEFSLN